MRVPHQTINELLRERRSVTPVIALRLSRLLGNSPEFWLNAQYAQKRVRFNILDRLELCGVVQETNSAIPKYLRNGQLEKIYKQKNALMNRSL